MDRENAATVFASYHMRSPPQYNASAFQPAHEDHLLIQPKKIGNPVLESKNHRVMQKELKLNNKLGIDVLNQKSELSKVFQEKRREYVPQEKAPKSEFDQIIESRRRGIDETEQKIEAEQSVPEFVKMRERLRKNS